MARRARTVQISRFGGPEVLEFSTCELAEPGPGEVLVNVEWIGINRAEVLWREGSYVMQPDPPVPIGMECSGRVEEIGAGVRGFSQGDQVGVVPTRFDPAKCGAYAEAVMVPATALLPTPSSLEGPEAAAVWMAYLTAWGGLLHVGGLAEDWHVVIPAASSSVGIAAIQLCQLEGAIPIAVTTQERKAEQLKELGAEYVIVSSRDDVADKVRAITDEQGAELFFDSVGGPLLAQELACAAPGAQIVVFGRFDRGAATLDAGAMIGKSLRLEGYHLMRTTMDPQVYDVAVGQIVDGIEEGALSPVVDRVFPFEEIQDAHRYAESREQVGKIVVEV